MEHEGEEPAKELRLVGVDPGATGALGLITAHGAQYFDMPNLKITRNGKARAEVNPRPLAELLNHIQPTHVFMEKVGGMPGQSAPAAFNFGRAVGAAEACCVSTGAIFHTVPPTKWKRAMGVRGDKDDSRHAAANLFPGLSKGLTRKRDADRAEALLIAAYGWAAVAGAFTGRTGVLEVG